MDQRKMVGRNVTSDGLNAVRENEVPVTEAIVEREGERSEVEREREKRENDGGHEESVCWK
jgi:6,7-dimethyl-8-ribityllumazine synthase